MNRRLVMGFVGLLALAHCAPAPPPPPVLNLTITGTAEQNPDPSGRASPVAVRVYQLSGTAKFSQADVFGLMNNEAKILGAEEATSSLEFLIAPGENKKVTVDLKPMVSAIGVAVLYRDIDHAQWRSTVSANAHGPTDVSAKIGRLALTLK